jgi:hypothetical protein
MADNRNALDKHLGLTEHDHVLLRYDRDRALVENVGQALAVQNYAAAQVYALLLVAERQEPETVNVHLTNWEDLAIAIGTHVRLDR